MAPFVERQREYYFHRGEVNTACTDVETAKDGWKVFNEMLVELSRLNNRQLQQLQETLVKGCVIPPWFGDYHRRLNAWVESEILERTLLK